MISVKRQQATDFWSYSLFFHQERFVHLQCILAYKLDVEKILKIIKDVVTSKQHYVTEEVAKSQECLFHFCNMQVLPLEDKGQVKKDATTNFTLKRPKKYLEDKDYIFNYTQFVTKIGEQLCR